MLVHPSTFDCLNFQASLRRNLSHLQPDLYGCFGTISNFNILLETEIIYSYKDNHFFILKEKIH